MVARFCILADSALSSIGATPAPRIEMLGRMNQKPFLLRSASASLEQILLSPPSGGFLGVYLESTRVGLSIVSWGEGQLLTCPLVSVCPVLGSLPVISSCIIFINFPLIACLLTSQ